MTHQIYEYHLYLFNQKEPIELTQVQGQKLAVLLAKNPNKKFIIIGEHLVNTSAIERLQESKKTYIDNSDGVNRIIPEIRKLTQEEKVAQEDYYKLKGKNLLTN